MRIDYIDKLKGVAIILVVMGHVLEKSIGVTDLPVNQFYGSFHMPLFMFLSGLFAYKNMNEITIVDTWTFLKKKALRILLPWLTIGALYTAVSQKDVTPIGGGETLSLSIFNGYWFLPSLFLCMLMGIVSLALSRKLKCLCKRNWICDVISIFSIYVAVCALYVLHINVPYHLNAVKMYPFFIMGYFVTKYELANKLLYADITYTLSIIAFVFMLYVLPDNLPIKLTGFFAIIFLMQLFKKYDASIPNWLNTIGKNSLEIYVLHWFFLPQLSTLKEIMLNQASIGVVDNSNFIGFLLVAFAFSVPIIGVCILISILIKNSKLLSLVIFGASQKK